MCDDAAEAPDLAFTLEDFTFMLQAVPGACIWLGQGGDALLHHPQYYFNDGVIATGIALFAQLRGGRCRKAGLTITGVEARSGRRLGEAARG